jgi:uncharacterized membrane protein YgdD (TMEM256/DUF423 family)
MNAAARRLMGTAALLIALATIFGAFAAHGLKSSLSAGQQQTLQTAVHYQFFNALGLFGIGLLRLRPESPVQLTRAGVLIAAGVVIFSGSLYALVLGAPTFLGTITPVGGVCMIAGWLWLAFQLL